MPIRQFRSRHHDYDDGGGGEGPNVDDDASAPDGDKENRAPAPTRDDSSPESAASSQGRHETERDKRGLRGRNFLGNFCESKTQGRHYYYAW